MYLNIKLENKEVVELENRNIDRQKVKPLTSDALKENFILDNINGECVVYHKTLFAN